MVKIKGVVDLEGLHEVTKAAALLCKSTATMWRWLRDDKISAVKVGGRILICECEIDRIKSIELPDQGTDILDMSISEI